MAEDNKGVDAKRIAAFGLLVAACAVFLYMGMQIGTSSEEEMGDGPVWWQVGPHSVGTLKTLTSTEADIQTESGVQTFEVNDHTMMVSFGGGAVAVGQTVLVKYVAGHQNKEARVIRPLRSTGAAASGSPSTSGSPAAGSASPAASGG